MPVTEYTQLYDNYDKAFVDWVRQLRYRGRPVLSVFATPERAFAQVRRQLRERKEEDLKVIPLPFVSIGRGSAAFDPGRFNPNKFPILYRTKDWIKHYTSRFPQPVVIPYQVDVWTRLLRDLDDLTIQLHTMLTANFTYLRVDHPFPFGWRIVFTVLSEVADASELEVGEEQRTLRRVFRFGVNGWVTYPAETIGIVEKTTVEIIDSPDLEEEKETLDTVVHVATRE